MKSTEFRIIERVGSFRVQRKSIYTLTKGFFWWKKETIIESWISIDNSGYSGIYANPFDTLCDAKKCIDNYIKYPIYHSIKH